MLTEEQFNYPKREYTFKVVATHFDQGSFEVQFIPKETHLISVTYNLPILADFDPNNLSVYVEKFAPYDRWFAQQIILDNEQKLLGN